MPNTEARERNRESDTMRPLLSRTAVMTSLDIVAYSRDHRRMLVVDCKMSKESSPESAARLRRNLMQHELLDEAPFFLLAFPTGLFLWKGEAKSDELPAFSAPAKPVLRTYLGKAAEDDANIRRASLEIALCSWLSDLVIGVRTPEANNEADQILVQSGLYEQIRHGEVRF